MTGDTVHDVRRWWNGMTRSWRRERLGLSERPIDSLTFQYLSQMEMRDVFLLYASLQRPRSQR